MLQYLLLHFLQVNFVGKLLGPQGSTIKRLQEDTGAKISVLGKGSMRDKNKVCVFLAALTLLLLSLCVMFCMLIIICLSMCLSGGRAEEGRRS